MPIDIETDTIKLEYIDESFLRIHCERAILREMTEHFRFRPANYQFMPKFRNKMWDGYVNLIDCRSRTMHVGHLNDIMVFCKNRGYKLLTTKGLEPPVLEKTPKLDKEAVALIESLNIHSDGLKITPYDYQIGAVEWALAHHRGILLSPTATGKSLMIYLMLHFYSQKILEDHEKILVVVPSTNLVEQMFSDFDDYASEISWNSEDNCNRIYSGMDRDATKKIVISTWQSIYRRPKDFFGQFGAIFMDECHLGEANSQKGILEKAGNCKYRFGLTGTLRESKCHKMVLQGLLGPIFQVTTYKKEMKHKRISTISIDSLILKYPESEAKPARKLKYHDERKFLTTHVGRNNFIANLALNIEGNTLILCELIGDHLHLLEDILNEKNTKNRNIHLIHGAVSAKDREKVRELMRTEKDAIILASYSTVQHGMNVKNLNNIIFASPSKSIVRVLQSIGRGLRITENKNSMRLYDIGDDLRGDTKKENFSYKHLLHRCKIYDDEHFEYKFRKISLKPTSKPPK